MKNYDTLRHVRGQSQFLDDITPPEDLLYAVIFTSPMAHGKIIKLNLDDALTNKSIRKIITAKDIPGDNQIGGIVPDEKLLADGEVGYAGEPIAIVVADDYLEARKACRNITVDIEELPAVLDPREACSRGNLIIPPRIFSSGNIDDAWQKCDFIIEGCAESGAQEHIYLETQGSMAIYQESGGIKIFSSTQSPTTVQRAASRVLALPMNLIEIDVPRLGGGFGGKEDQANSFGAMAALAACLLKRPVKLVLNRQEDIRITGKRHPYSTDFKIGLTKDCRIMAFEAVFYQNAGASADLSPAVLDRTLFHCSNSYYIPNLKATGYSCRTNLPPNTAFRGFGGPQGMFAIESAIFKAAETIGCEASFIQEMNLLKEGDQFHYGQIAENCRAQITWQKAKEKFDIDTLNKRIDDFNSRNKFYKKGIAFMPLCFGISFTNTFMNQASALVHVYSDGSISISTAAVEMGQGVNMKIRQAAAKKFSVDIDRIKIESSNTTRIANTSPTAASSGADLNGKAAEMACTEILQRLISFCAIELKDKPENISIIDETVYVSKKKTLLTWGKLVKNAFMNRVNLSAHAQYAIPGIYFDKEKLKGRAFNYHVYGTAIIEATVDCLRGTCKVDSVRAVHDFGDSFNKVIDRGQAEGAVLQGIGWMTLEEIIYDNKGILKTDSLSTYKVPDIYTAPELMEFEFLDEDPGHPSGLMNSKAVGEPPLMYGIGSYFAIINAMKAFRKGKEFNIPAPLTNEKNSYGALSGFRSNS